MGHTHSMKPLPAPAYLAEYLDYRNGQLFWKKRPDSLQLLSTRLRNSWDGRFLGKRAGSPMRHGYRLITVDGSRYLEHRIIFQMLRGPFDGGQYVDHINHDHTDNRIENLRLCSHAENLMNQPGRPSKYGALPKHVHWNENEQKYKVVLRANGKAHHIGTFSTLDEASTAAKDARARLHGEFKNDEAAA